MALKPFMTIREAAGASGLSQKFIRDEVKNGRIPFLKVGNRYMINFSLLMEWLEAKCKEGDPQ